MYIKCVYFIAFVFVLFLFELPQAQETKSVSRSPESPSHAEQKPLSPETGGSPAPLSIDQIQAHQPLSPAERFEYLRRHRKITLDAIAESTTKKANLSARLSFLQDKSPDLENTQHRVEYYGKLPSKDRVKTNLEDARTRLREAKTALSAIKAKNKPDQDEISKLEEAVVDSQQALDELQETYENYEARQKDYDKRKQEAEAAVRANTEEISNITNQSNQVAQSQLSYQRLLGEIDDMVNQLFIASDATNRFKLNMSIAYTLLVGIVIIGFYTVVRSNEEIKKTIFSNESGIQFITMFAIVIAVILFGIIGVLESKELSALLGGLSGYILGKSRAAAPSQGG